MRRLIFFGKYVLTYLILFGLQCAGLLCFDAPVWVAFTSGLAIGVLTILIGNKWAKK